MAESSPLPFVGVVSAVNFPGIDRPDEAQPAMRCMPLDEALLTPWPHDAWFTTYEPIHGEQHLSAWPRINKPALPSLRARGAEVVANMLVVEHDLPHAPGAKVAWTPQSYSEFIDLLLSLRDSSFTLPLDFTAAYTTRHGFRWVYVLTRPVPVDQAEGLVLGIIRDFARVGIKLDSACKDWTRLFRLPCVMRDGRPTWEEDTFDLVQQLDKRLDPDSIVPALPTHSTKYAEIRELDLPQPSPEHAHALLWTIPEEGKREVRTPWFRAAKARLQGHNCYPCIFEHAPIAEESARDSTIQRYVGQAIAYLHRLEGSSPELIYALFLPSVEQLKPDAQTPDWTVVLWSAVLRYWAREAAKEEAAAQDAAKLAQDNQHFALRVLEGARLWCAHPKIWRSEAESLGFLSSILIAATSQLCYVMTPAGHYDSIGVPRHLLSARIRSLGMDALISLERETENGKRAVPAQTIIDRHATIVSTVRGAVDIPRTTIKDIESDSATLVLKLFDLRTDLEPRFDPQVDAWLKTFAGDQYHRLCEWIGHALDFKSGPICALSIAGPPGAGKKLLIQGLAECINTETFGDEREFGNFQSALLRTPFIVVNEGVPTMRDGQKDIADTFRHLVGGDAITCNQKFQAPIIVNNPARIIFAANNMDAVSILTGHRDLTPEDRDALAIRLMHIDIPQSAGDWLRMRGGLSYTGAFGRRWIRGDSGAASDYVVARHFLHLYEQRPPVPVGNRLLVEGHLQDDLLRAMSTRSGSAPDIIESLVRMIEGGPMEGLVIDGKTVLVTVDAVVSWYRRNATHANPRINHRSASKVFRGLCKRGALASPRTVEASGKKKRARWYEIDVKTLLVESIENGFACERLARLVSEIEAGVG